jgi:hypothetical protein
MLREMQIGKTTFLPQAERLRHLGRDRDAPSEVEEMN